MRVSGWLKYKQPGDSGEISSLLESSILYKQDANRISNRTLGNRTLLISIEP